MTKVNCPWRKQLVKVVMLVLSLFLLPICSHAQDTPYTLHFGAGFTPLVGSVSSRLDNGWHITIGGGYNFTPHFTTTLDYSFHGLGVTQKVLTEAGVPDGNAHLQSVTVNPKLRLNPHSKVDPYVIGGVGYYRRTVEFTRPVLAQVFLFDPFFGVFFDTLVPANQILGKMIGDGIGGSLGAGFDIKFGDSGVKFFTEARYHYASTGRIVTRMIPLTFGVRW